MSMGTSWEDNKFKVKKYKRKGEKARGVYGGVLWWYQ